MKYFIAIICLVFLVFCSDEHDFFPTELELGDSIYEETYFPFVGGSGISKAFYVYELDQGVSDKILNEGYNFLNNMPSTDAYNNKIDELKYRSDHTSFSEWNTLPIAKSKKWVRFSKSRKYSKEYIKECPQKCKKKSAKSCIKTCSHDPTERCFQGCEGRKTRWCLEDCAYIGSKEYANIDHTLNSAYEFFGNEEGKVSTTPDGKPYSQFTDEIDPEYLEEFHKILNSNNGYYSYGGRNGNNIMIVSPQYNKAYYLYR